MTLGLAVKLQHRHGSSELIRLLHDHGFIVSYDEVIRFRKSAAKFVGDNDRSSILHQAMGVSRRVGPIFGWFDNLDLLISTPNGRRDTHVMVQEFQQHPSGILETGSAQPGSMNLVIPSCLLLSASLALKISTSRSVPLQHYMGPKKFHIPYSDVCARNESCSCSAEGHQMAEFRCHQITAWSGMDTNKLIQC